MSSSIQPVHLSQPKTSRFDAIWYRTRFGAEERLVGVSRSNRPSDKPKVLVPVERRTPSPRAPILVQDPRRSIAGCSVDNLSSTAHGSMTPASPDGDKFGSKPAKQMSFTLLDSQDVRNSKKQETSTLPPAPRPSRLPTPDLPDISCSRFCTCCNRPGTEPREMKIQ
ncbi:MAG: hypothetical protein M1835_006111 [Candelina submexicana]|nr:MAG: hypothetical protein M1835_006111 [Candelina submexicana]